ncbi:MAG: DNA polymerase III subunit delta [Peptostreptococcaceae bacterium]|nr:DNA polymerase III subunit delta [Peptostreptococcaceae bacterium]
MDLNKLMELPANIGQRVFFVDGEEKYIADRFVEYMKKKHLKGCVEEMNLHKIEQISDLKDIEEKIVTLPFMCDARMVVVSDFIKIAAEMLKSKEELDSFIGKVPETTVLVLLNGRVDKRSIVYKFFKKKKLIVEAKRLTPESYEAWVEDFIITRGVSITKVDKKYLTQQLGYFNKERPKNMYDSESELKKLLGSLNGRGTIERKDFEGFLDTRGETNIFKLTDSISEAHTALALESLEILCEMGEPEIKILFMISRHFRQIMKVKSLQSGGCSKEETMKTLGIKSDFVFKKNLRYARGLEMAAIGRIMELCMETELKCKSLSSQKRLAIEVLICQISGVIIDGKQR